MKYFLIAFISLFTFILTSKDYEKEIEELRGAGYLIEDYVDDTWVVRVQKYGDKNHNKEWEVHASVNGGEMMWGDALRVRIQLENIEQCHKGNMFTHFYTYTDNENIKKLHNVRMAAKFREVDIIVLILYPKKFLAGYRPIVDITHNKLDDLKGFLKGYNSVKLQLVDNEEVTVKDYFDRDYNTYSLKGFDDAIDRARNECIRIINERKN